VDPISIRALITVVAILSLIVALSQFGGRKK